MIKIDIEGYERPAFQGFLQTMKRDRPIAFFELNVTNEEGFHSEEELLSVFPEKYEFFEVKRGAEFGWTLPGNRMLLCADPEGGYTLRPFDMRFDEDGRNLVALPAELVPKVI